MLFTDWLCTSTVIGKLCPAIEEEWDNITQATINSLINCMQRRRVRLHEANGGQQMHICDQNNAFLYSQSCEIHKLGFMHLF